MSSGPLRIRDLPQAWQAPRRIIIIGPSGSGKTTLGKALAGLLDYPAIDLDDLYWLPGWQGREDEDFLKLVEAAVQADSWVLSGNYQRSQFLTWPRAELVIFLDFSLALALSRVFRRCLRRSLRHESVCNGNYESLQKTLLSKDSLLGWVLKVHKPQRERYRKRFGDKTAPPILWLRRPAEVAKLLEAVGLLERSKIER